VFTDQFLGATFEQKCHATIPHHRLKVTFEDQQYGFDGDLHANFLNLPLSNL
jgi:hypothetical protein